MGIGRHDLHAAIETSTGTVERRTAVAEVNGRVFRNNVCLGICDVDRPHAYRDAEMRSIRETAQEVLGHCAQAPSRHYGQ